MGIEKGLYSARYGLVQGRGRGWLEVDGLRPEEDDGTYACWVEGLQSGCEEGDTALKGRRGCRVGLTLKMGGF